MSVPEPIDGLLGFPLHCVAHKKQVARMPKLRHHILARPRGSRSEYDRESRTALRDTARSRRIVRDRNENAKSRSRVMIINHKNNSNSNSSNNYNNDNNHVLWRRAVALWRRAVALCWRGSALVRWRREQAISFGEIVRFSLRIDPTVWWRSAVALWRRGAVLWRCGGVLWRCGGVLWRCGGVLWRCGGVLWRCGGVL